MRRKTSGGAALYLLLLILTIFFIDVCKGSSPTSPSNGGNLISLSGLVMQSGQPFSDVMVYLSRGASRKTTTGADGKFAFSDLPKGDYVITPSKLGYLFSPSNSEVGSSSRSDLNFSAQSATTGTEVDSIATNFEAKDQNGDSVELSNYHGKVVLFDFTADWCIECRDKAETAEAFYQKFKNNEFMYILIVIEGSASTWAKQYSLTFPVLDDNSKAIYNLYRKAKIPLPHVLDRNLTIRYKNEGWVQAEVENVINKYL